MGAGVLAQKSGRKSARRGFPLRCWSRSRKIPARRGKVMRGCEEPRAFPNQTRVPINLPPNTAQTVGIINSELLINCRMAPTC